MNRHRWMVSFALIVMTLMALMVSAAAPAASPSVFRTTLPPPPAPEAPEPIIILTIHDPWRMVIGSDEPTFALYETGLVLYQRENDNGEWELASVVLDEDELQTLRDSLRIDADLYALDDEYDNVAITDQPSNTIEIYDAELGEKTFWIYGNLRIDSPERDEFAPERLLDLFDLMANFVHEDAKTWLPGQFEVILWPYETSEATQWPEDWPGLDDESTIKRDSVYSLYIDIEEYDRFRELAKDANAFELDGQTWTFSLRFPFPHEHYVYRFE
ncbi:MAG: hypothetical protein K8L97_18055 [Anaerolineae bacterium]|nr:hypothetical protein [Anaerolineae bacterium]